ncbi:MAG TPA: dihydrofolate reductase family protein [Streptosporangiaceae bacterium]|nr:dihydrofolate reductase family protein [Streptosporangiaceae bacterium]
MRQLLPVPRDPVDPGDLYGDLPPAGARPVVRLNMIASIDGATAVAGLSGGLGGPADHALFAVLRAQADVVLVAAGTVRAEHYGPSEVPVAVISRSCRLDWDSPFFTDAITPPIVITVAKAPALERKKAADLAEVIIAGEQDVDLAAALGALAERGYAQVLAEGGPTLNGQLAADGLLDELCLTVSPLLAGGEAKRILAGPALAAGPGWRLRSLCEQDGFLFLRYRPQ